MGTMMRSFEGLRGLPPKKLVLMLCSTVLGVILVLSFLNPAYHRGALQSIAGGGQPEPSTPSPSPIAIAEPTPSQPPKPEDPPSPAIAASLVPLGYVGTCGNETHAAARKVWLEAEARYSHLMDDKFTIAILTYKRPDVLNITLTALLASPIPSLHEIVIISNDNTTLPPPPYTSPHGVLVRFRTSPLNSLNVRFLPDPAYQTQAILSHDDDVWYSPSDLEFAFQSWRQLGRYRVTGALPRCYSRDGKTNKLSYHPCRKGSDWYALVLTNLAFVHISLMDYYSSPEAIPTLVRQHVDSKFNCEDIGMNYVASMLTCSGPLHVQGLERYQNQDPKEGISRGGGHQGKRNGCLNYFEEVVGFLPLVRQMGSVKRGMDWFN